MEATTESEDATPAANSENQVLSQKPGSCLHCCSAPCTAAGTGHLAATLCSSLLSATPPFQTSLSPVCYPPHAVLVLFLSTCATQISFLLPPSSLASGPGWLEGCARMYQIADNMWLVGMTIELPKSNTANKGLCSLVIPVLPVNPLGSSL